MTILASLSVLTIFSEVNRLNQAFFGGARVLGAINGALTVNTALLQGGGGFRAVPVLTQPLPASVYVSQPQPMPYSTPTPVASPQISSNKNTGAPSVRELNYSAIPSAEPVTVAAVPFQPQQPRMLYVTVPPNATTGQILTVSAPTGQLVQVCTLFSLIYWLRVTLTVLGNSPSRCKSRAESYGLLLINVKNCVAVIYYHDHAVLSS